MPVAVSALGNDVLEQSAVAELRRNAGPLAGQDPPSAGFAERAGAERAGRTVVGTVTEMRAAFPKIAIPDLGPDAYWIHAEPAGEKQLLLIAGGDARGALYGAFAFLRSPAAGNTFQTGAERSSPAMTVRWVDEWDNADGSIERGYGGRSIFFEGGKVREDLAPVREYARLLASVGIDGCDVNNVNNAAPFLDSAMLKGLARVADAMRPWGVRLALSADVASPQKIGGLATYDPLDPQVKAWWKAKVEEIYALIPDFAARTGELWTNAGGGGEHAGGRAGSAWRGGVVSRVCLQPSSGLER
jgi:alpha-glucuronidase